MCVLIVIVKYILSKRFLNSQTIFLFIFYFLFYNYDSKIINKILNLAKEQNISIKFRDYKLRGKNEKPIDNFIDSIESD